LTRARLGAASAAAPLRVLLGLALLSAGCVQSTSLLLPGALAARPCAEAAEVADSVFLIGAAGGPKLPRHPEAILPVDPVLRRLREDVMEQTGALGVGRVAVVFLGDNVQPDGLPPTGLEGRSRGERVLRQQIEAAGPARVVFVAGDRDWGLGAPGGWSRVRAQHGFLSLQGPRVAMLPAGGCSGPGRLDFGAHLRLLFFDPLALRHALDAPTQHAEACPGDGVPDSLLALRGELDRPEGRHVILAQHPLLVSAPVGAGSSSGSAGATAATAYAPTTVVVHRALRPRVPILVAGGDAPGLELRRDALGAYYAASGAGGAARGGALDAGPGTLFSLAEPGYLRLDVHADGALTLAAVAVRGERRETVASHCLADGPAS